MWVFLRSLIELWKGWEIRALVLLSLKLQIILIVLGSRRKVTTNILVKIIVWSAYMSADWVATVTLGILARGDPGNSPKIIHPLQSFWAPFLLLHLGGPDTITAYSLEDNQLWLRHLLGLVVEIGVAFYVFLRSSDDTVLTLIAIPVIIAAIIKYGERTWVLRSASSKNFRDSLLSDPDPGPDYMESSSSASGVDEDLVSSTKTVLPQRYTGSRHDHLSQAYYLFNRLKYLFADLILGYYERKDCNSMINDKSSEEAFSLVEGELGFLYDMLYTKATIVYSRWGFLLRCISFFSSIFAWIIFAIFIDEHAYSMVDISITYSLLIGAVALEVYALFLIILSDWTKVWLVDLLIQGGSIGKRWSRTTSKGDYVLYKRKCLDLLKWSTTDVEFDHSLLLWHIATQLCYYQDIKDNIINGSSTLHGYTKISLSLSDYMLYLLVMCPDMLPKGIGEIRYRDTCAEAIRFFKQRKKIGSKVDEACQELHEVDTGSLENVKRDQTKSVLLYGCKLAQQLQSLLNQHGWDYKKKWEMMNEVWVELLAYAAVHCGWKEHGQQLMNGGELLTHVCVLATHFGLSSQFQIEKEYFKEYLHIREVSSINWQCDCDPCLLPLLYLCLAPYWCMQRVKNIFSRSPNDIYATNLESIFSFSQ
ncbi:hypothetical protein PTKIN_Ptkin07bG0060000 [Pterospermum kingtungense]